MFDEFDDDEELDLISEKDSDDSDHGERRVTLGEVNMQPSSCDCPSCFVWCVRFIVTGAPLFFNTLGS